MSRRYQLNARDMTLLSAATILLKKVAAAETTRSAQLVTVAKLLHVLSVLPRVTPGVTASVSVRCPRHWFDDIETYHWWDFEIEDGQLCITSGGHFYRPSTGGDTFTTMVWGAVPEEPAELNDYRESLRLVPDLQSFSEGVDSIDLASGGYTVEILDDDNPLLDEEQDEEFEDEDVEAEADGAQREGTDTETLGEQPPRNWSMTPIDAAEERLAALVDPDTVDARKPACAYNVNRCDHCLCCLDQRGLYVDGRLRGDLMWSSMCVYCFANLGEGIGWGAGQLYARQPDGQWRMVAGWEAADRWIVP